MGHHSRELLPLLGVVLAVLLHIGGGAPRAEGMRFVALMIVGGASFVYFRALAEESQRLGLRLMALSGSVLGVYAIAQALGLDFFSYPSESWMYRVVTTLGHRNFTAIFLLVSLFAALDVREAGQKAVRRWAGAAVVPTYLGLLATGARFPILLASMGLFVVALRHRVIRRVVAVLFVAFVVWLSVIVQRGEVAQVLTRTETFQVRADLYRALGGLGLENPVVGLGVGSFAHRIPEELANRGSGQSAGLVFLHAHNLPAELFIELGVLGLLCALWLPAKVFAAALRHRAWRTDWLVWALCGWMVTNLYDVNFFSYAGWVSFWPILGVVGSRYGTVGLSSTGGSRLSLAHSLPLVASLVVVTLFLLPMVVSSNLTRRALLAGDLGLLGTEQGLWEAAESVGPLPLEHRYRAAVSRISPGPSEEGVRLLEVIDNDAPGFSAVRLNIAIGLGQLGRYEEGLDWIDRHLDAYPLDSRAAEAKAELLNQTVGLEGLANDRR